ncbi:MAG TPA: electron transfer flavoprotein subunit beta/FixA family protein [Anaerolineales bacterium]|nr:electron transfer flavoprotein subunit beta/FixA family protein [Anaerolineales bacterium]
MHLVVCVKQTPDSAAKMGVENGRVTWGDAGLIVNPWDEYAVEEAIRLKEKHGGKVTAISLGSESAKEALKTCIAMGCDEAILLSDAAFAGSDALATSYALTRAIEKMGDVDIALFGKQAIDGDTGLVPVAVARRLGWTPLTYTIKIAELDLAARTIRAERLLEQGKQVVTSRLPAVVGTVKDINEPRYPSFMGIRKAAKAAIPIWSAADVGCETNKIGEAGSATRWPAVYPLPAREGAAEMIEGTPEEIAAKLADKLIADKVI